MALKAKTTKKKAPSVFDGSQSGKVEQRTPSGNVRTLTVYELGNCDRGIFPTEDELAKFRELVEEVSRGEKNSIFVPQGLVKVTQYFL